MSQKERPVKRIAKRGLGLIHPVWQDKFRRVLMDLDRSETTFLSLKTERVLDKTIRVLARELTQDRHIFHEVFETYRISKLASQLDREAELTIIDVGGHIGSFSLMMAAFFPNSTIHTYELFPENVEMIRMNVLLNGFEKQIHVHAAVLSDCSGSWDPAAYLGMTDENTGGISVAMQDFGDSPEPTASARRLVPVLSAREALEKFEVIDLVKLDCEGSEYRILYSLPEPQIEKIRLLVGELHASPDFHKNQTAGQIWSDIEFYDKLTKRFSNLKKYHRTEHAWGYTEMFFAMKLR